MNDLVMLSVLCAIFVFFAVVCFIISIGCTYTGKVNGVTKNSFLYFSLFLLLFCIICMCLSLWNIIDYLLI